MRTGRPARWDWSMIDRIDFAECIIPRAKTGTPQALASPARSRPSFARGGSAREARRAARYSPRASARGPGRRSARRTAIAKRLRRALFRAGMLPPAARRGARDEPGHADRPRQAARGHEARAEPARPALLRDGDHAARRLPLVPARVHHGARGGGRQRAARDALASHSDPRVHARYVMRTAAMRRSPTRRSPDCPRARSTERPKSRGIVTARDDCRGGTRSRPKS